MCGISGVFGANAGELLVQRMLDSMPHRGPDGTGTWQGEGIALGHRRLAIVDLSDSGRQPMISPGGDLIATVNGEIYNYPDLRRELEAEGAIFASSCDSEVVLHAYRAWGAASFARFNGMFAFGLWDNRSRKLFVVRDRLGIKPVYYLQDQNAVLFASDIKALLAATGSKTWAIDPMSLSHYLTFQNLLGDQTMFSGIKALIPGHYLECSNAGTVSRPYWELEFGPTGIADFETAVASTRTRLREAVARHLMSDVPVAAYLSAGIDSTLVATTAASMLSEPLATFTGSFTEGGWYDETSGASAVAKKIGSPHTAVSIDHETFKRSFDDVIFSLDEPRMGMGAFPQYVVAAEAAKSRKMILTGHGGDELFSGYPIFKAVLVARLFARTPIAALRLLLSFRPSEVPHLVYFAWRSLVGRGLGKSLPELFSRRLQSAALQPDVARVVVAENAPTGSPISHDTNSYRRLMRTYLQVYLPGLLTVEDKISMAHSLESRTPLLDNEIVALSLSISEKTKLSNGTLKAILRKIAEGELPPEISSLPKRGFPTPLARWLRGELLEWMTKRICGEHSHLRRLFRADYLEEAVRSYQSSWRRRIRPLDEIPTHRMWMLLSLESWLRQHEDRLGIRLELGLPCKAP